MRFKTIYGVLFRNKLYNVENDEEYEIADWKMWWKKEARCGFFLLARYFESFCILKYVSNSKLEAREDSHPTPLFLQNDILKKIQLEFGNYTSTQRIFSKWL